MAAVPPPPYLPPDDRVLSPYTGWTRAHWEALADRLLDALVPYASPGGAQYRLPGRTSRSGERSDGLEGFARSFLLAAFRVAGARHDPDAADRVSALADRYARGLSAGADPDAPDAWPRITERSQPMVEAASVAVGLHETRELIWQRLDDRARRHLVDWLGGFVGKRPVDNNWRLFQVVVEQFLASVGGPYRQREIDGGLDRIEDWYLGDGWYSDGDGRAFDYYNGWALHFYPLLWARIAGAAPGGADPARVAVHRERLRLFLDGHQHFFGADGGPVHQGRSLTYRFASAAPLWMGALTGATPLAPGLTRRLASGAARHFTDRGAPDERGLLRLGWYRPYLPMTQTYSGPASPYWASKGFLGLLVPVADPVWSEPELPCAVEESDTRVVLPGPGWLLHGTRADGIVRLLNHGSDNNLPDDPDAADDPHYSRFAYSTRTAPLTGPDVAADRVDGHFAVLAEDGTPSRRTVVRPLRVGPDAVSSWHEARPAGGGPGRRVTTVALPSGPCEVRVHRVSAAAGAVPPGAGRTAAGAGAGPAVRDGGYPVADRTPPREERGDGWALVRGADGLCSAVVALHGWRDAAVRRAEDADAFGVCSAVPYLRAPLPPDRAALYVSLVVLSGAPLDVPTLRAGFEVAVDGTRVRIGFPDGTERRVDLPGGTVPAGPPRP